MSRLASMSPAAIRAMFSTDSDSTLITLLTIYDPVTQEPVARLADNFVTRISEDEEEVYYGVVSRSNNYYFLPLDITLPSDDEGTSPSCAIVINDVTRYIIPLIRELAEPPKLLMELVLSSSPDTVEAYFSDFYIGNITYNATTVTLNLEMINYSKEPFPCYSFTPAIFPGLF